MRFKVKNTSQVVVFESNETIKIYVYLKDKIALDEFYVECTVDDIEVHSDDFCDTFRKGKNPLDLTNF